MIILTWLTSNAARLMCNLILIGQYFSIVAISVNVDLK
jgi:hypothetical protein